MAPSRSTIPPLPEGWPYPGRAPLPALAVRAEVPLPGQGPGWSLEAEPDLLLTGGFEPLGGAFGRGGVGRSGEVVLRPYRRGGLIRHFNARTYADPERFRAELEIHRRLWEAGFPTVRPLGCAWRRHRWGVEGVYLTAFTPGTPWPRKWDESCWPEVVTAIGALADWGCWSPDLNATNIHLVPGRGALILDFDRAAFTTPQGLRGRYAARLRRSLGKLGAPIPLCARLEGTGW